MDSQHPTSFAIARAPPGLDILSLDQVKACLRLDTEVFPDFVQTIKHLVAEGNLVAL